MASRRAPGGRLQRARHTRNQCLVHIVLWWPPGGPSGGACSGPDARGNSVELVGSKRGTEICRVKGNRNSLSRHVFVHMGVLIFVMLKKSKIRDCTRSVASHLPPDISRTR